MNDYTAEIRDACLKYGLDPALVTAVVEQESTYRTHAYRFEASVAQWFRGHPKAAVLSPARYAASYGLMQCLYATATDYGFALEPEYLFIPKIGLDYGCRHLAALLKWAKHDHALALAAYNGGKGNADKAGPRFYARKVLGRIPSAA